MRVSSRSRVHWKLVAFKVQRRGRRAHEHLEEPSARLQEAQARLMRLRTDSRGGHVPELCRYSPRDERDFPVARARDEAGGCRVVAPSKELREVPERRGRGVRADELRRGVQQGFEHGRRVPADRGRHVRQRGADVKHESAGERRDAGGAERREHAALKRASRRGADDLLLVHEPLGDLLYARRGARDERARVVLEQLLDPVERVFSHPRAVVLALVQELRHGQAAAGDLPPLALRTDGLDAEVDALGLDLGVGLVSLLADLTPNLLLGADEVDARALLVVHALGLLTHLEDSLRL